MTYTKRQWQKMVSVIKKKYSIEVVLTKLVSTKSSAHCWNINNQKITIGTKDAPWLVLGALVHELGHCLSIRSGRNAIDMANYMAYKLGALLEHDSGERLLKEERRAWDYGYRFLRENGIKLNKDMFWMRDILLETHVKQLARISSRQNA